jgi:hypothetical protein
MIKIESEAENKSNEQFAKRAHSVLGKTRKRRRREEEEERKMLEWHKRLISNNKRKGLVRPTRLFV